MVPDDRKLAAGRSSAPDVRLAMWMMVAVFGLFILIGTTAGLVFNTMTIALPKVIDERIGSGISLVAVGGIATAVFLCGAVAQLAVGRVIEKYPAHLVFAFTGLMQFIGVVWVVYATGYALLGALAFAIAFVYAQVTVNDFVIARYTADAWRARVYAVRYFITYVISGAAITMIAFLHSRGGFDLVLTVTAVIAMGFVIGTAGVALLVNGVERESKVGRSRPNSRVRTAPARDRRRSRRCAHARSRRCGSGGSNPCRARSRAGTPAGLDFTIETSSSIASIASGVLRCLA